MFGRTVRLTLDEPWKLAILSNMSREVVKENKKRLGALPDYMQGLLLTGSKDKSGKPRAISTYGANPFSAVSDITSQGLSLLSGDPSLQGVSPIAGMNPYIKSGLEAAFHVNSFTGAPLPKGSLGGTYAHQLAGNFPLYSAYDKYEHPSTSPALERNLRDTIESYLGVSTGSVDMTNVRRNLAIQALMQRKDEAAQRRHDAKMKAAKQAAGR
jgi:hypothetical protein